HVMVTDIHDRVGLWHLIGGNCVVIEADLVGSNAASIRQGAVSGLIKRAEGAGLISQLVGDRDVIGEKVVGESCIDIGVICTASPDVHYVHAVKSVVFGEAVGGDYEGKG